MITDYRFKKEFIKKYLKNTDKKFCIHKGYIYSITKDVKNFNSNQKFTIQEFYDFITN